MFALEITRKETATCNDMYIGWFMYKFINRHVIEKQFGFTKPVKGKRQASKQEGPEITRGLR